MNLLFIHQNMPAQFKHLAPHFAQKENNKVLFITKRRDAPVAGVEALVYQPTRFASKSTHHYVRLFENAVLHGQQVLRVCRDIDRQGFRPDVIIGHPGWGETLFIKDVFPNVPLLNYCEFYYHGSGADVGFDREAPTSLDAIYRARARNAHLLLSLESCDRGISPTKWQKSVHPEAFHSKISVVFDGIDTDVVKPDDRVRFNLPDGRSFSRADEVVTYAARNLEPYRGFPSFIRAIPQILAERPNAHVIIAGGDGVDYGQSAPNGRTWREVMLEEVPVRSPRVHFVGQVPYADYLKLLQVSSAHVYLTVPFSLSWSCVEALAAGALVVGSATPPVQEVIRDGENGFLVDFFSPTAIAERVVSILSSPSGMTDIRKQARRTVLDRYSLSKCLPKQVRMIEEMA